LIPSRVELAITLASNVPLSVAPRKSKRSKFLKIAELPIVIKDASTVSTPSPPSMLAPDVTAPDVPLATASLPAPNAMVVVTKPPAVAVVEPIEPANVTLSAPEPVVIA